MCLAIDNSLMKDLAICYSSLFPLIIFSNNLKIEKKIAQAYIKGIPKIFLSGFQCIRNPYLFVLFLKTFLEFAKVFPHGIQVISSNGEDPLINTKLDFLVPECETCKIIVKQAVCNNKLEFQLPEDYKKNECILNEMISKAYEKAR